MLVLVVTHATVEERQQDRAIFHGFDILVLGIHCYGPEDHLEVGVHIENFLMGVQHRDLTPATGGCPVHRKFGFASICVSSHAGTSDSDKGRLTMADSSWSIVDGPWSFPQFKGPNLRISSTNRVVSLANRAPSAALAQTSFTRSGSMPIPCSTRLSSR